MMKDSANSVSPLQLHIHSGFGFPHLSYYTRPPCSPEPSQELFPSPILGKNGVGATLELKVFVCLLSKNNMIMLLR